jgi:nitrous oxidase accessory protein NosD
VSLLNHRRTLIRVACLAAVGVAYTVVATQADAATAPAVAVHHQVRWVHPGQSVQAAVDASQPGDTVRLAPGTYAEQVHIATSGVSLIGSGADTVLTSPANPVLAPQPAGGKPGADGVTVGGAGTTVRDVQVSAMKVTGFSGAGVALQNTADVRVDHIDAADNAYEGIQATASTHPMITNDAASGAGHAGIDIASSPGSAAVVEHDSVTGNGHGILVLSSSDGTIAGNDIQGNDTGVLVLTLDPTTHASHWNITGNRVVRNNAFTTPPTVSGGGIGVVGADHVTISGNVITGNRPTGPTMVSGGVVFVTLPAKTPIPSTDNTVSWNVITGNAPFDVAHDALSTGNTIGFNAGNPTTGVITVAAK